MPLQTRRRWLGLLAASGVQASLGQVIEFESGGLKYLTQTRNGVTVMFAHMPLQVREYAVIQVAVSNGSSGIWDFKPEDFRFRRTDGATIRAASARDVVSGFMQRGGRDDVVRLVSTYELALYGMNRRSTNGYESRRQAAIAEVTSTRMKAAAAASAIVFVPVKLKPGESTDGAVFYPSSGRPLGSGKLMVSSAGTVFEFDTNSAPAP
jgi:hypothetical protein